MNIIMFRRVSLLIILLAVLATTPLSAGRKDRKDRPDNPLLKQKSITAIKIDNPPVIDGKLDDKQWMYADIADKFIQYSPFNGSPSKYRTEVRVLYDNSAIYVGAMMYDPNPDSIYKELGECRPVYN